MMWLPQTEQRGLALARTSPWGSQTNTAQTPAVMTDMTMWRAFIPPLIAGLLARTVRWQ